MARFDGGRRATEDPITSHGDGRPADGVPRATVLERSKHSDGSILRGDDDWHIQYRTAERAETRLEPMALSDPTNCRPNRNNCREHLPCAMMQIFSLRLAYAKLGVDDGPIQLYGYLAARDLLEPLLNFVFHRSREDPFILEQGSVIEVTGPKRGIDMQSGVLLEFDMKIKKGEHESEDLQLIDGASYFSELSTPSCKVFTARIEGDYGAVDISSALLHNAVEATIDVGVSQVDSNVNLSLTSLVSGLCEEIHLFRGVMSKTSGVKRFVIAVVSGTQLVLKFKIGQMAPDDVVDCSCSFNATEHGCSSDELTLAFTTISVKVHWSTLVVSV